MSYWDIDDYLAEEQLAAYRFTLDAPGMAFLDSSKGLGDTVPADSLLNSHIWIVMALRDYILPTQEGQIVQVEVPKFLRREHNEGYYKSLETDRTANLQTLNLKQKSQYFYQIYQALQKALENSKNLIDLQQIKTMLCVRGSRIIEIASMHQEETRAEAKYRNYIEFEKELFRTIRNKSLLYEKWERHDRD